MYWIGKLFVLITFLVYEDVSCVITKRSLIFPRPNGKVQAIMGAGFPVVVRDEAVIIGIVVKASYHLPTNSSVFIHPQIEYLKKRSIKRWNIYTLIEETLKLYGLGGKQCILRTICECASIPIDKSTGLISEIFHVLFNPTTTNDKLIHHTDNEYYSAYEIGIKEKNNCQAVFPDCIHNFLDLFTKVK